jgi:hypothetical protein
LVTVARHERAGRRPRALRLRIFDLRFGDSFFTNAVVDNALIAPHAGCDARASLYANRHDLKNPLLSPIFWRYASMSADHPQCWTRDLLLSNTVRVGLPPIASELACPE